MPAEPSILDRKVRSDREEQLRDPRELYKTIMFLEDQARNQDELIGLLINLVTECNETVHLVLGIIEETASRGG